MLWKEKTDFEKFHLKFANLALFLLEGLYRRLILTTLWTLDWYEFLDSDRNKLQASHLHLSWVNP